MQGGELPARNRGLHLIGAAGGDAVLITHGLCARTAQSAAAPQSALLARRGASGRPLWRGCRAGRAPQNFAPILRPQHSVPSARALTTDERPTAAVLPGAAAPSRSSRQERQLRVRPMHQLGAHWLPHWPAWMCTISRIVPGQAAVSAAQGRQILCCAASMRLLSSLQAGAHFDYHCTQQTRETPERSC